ncbi:MAG: TatD family nuclease-associated radical SAM protein [Clostridiales bacterium]|nr:TatD family nuclease-associated radical SAM protein [Clostridiales bacterium]
MIITYTHKNGLYVNMTNRCSNRCDFCVRSHGDTLYGNLWLDREPTKDEIWESITEKGLSSFSEIVFCGYGEPTERLDDMLELCRMIRKTSNIKIRINTNGQSDLINGRPTAKEFEGLFDTVSISLNSSSPEVYDGACHSKFGILAHSALIEFAKEVKKYVPEVVMSVVDTTISEEDKAECAKICDEIGVSFRVREYI